MSLASILTSRASTVAAAALLLTVGGVGGAVAGTVITSKQIKDHTIQAVDMKKASVNSKAIKNHSVRKKDLAFGVGTVSAQSTVTSTGGNVSLPDVNCPPRTWAMPIGGPSSMYIFEDDIVGSNGPVNPGNGTVTATEVTDHFGQITGFSNITVTQTSNSDKHSYTFRVLCG